MKLKNQFFNNPKITWMRVTIYFFQNDFWMYILCAGFYDFTLAKKNSRMRPFTTNNLPYIHQMNVQTKNHLAIKFAKFAAYLIQSQVVNTMLKSATNIMPVYAISSKIWKIVNLTTYKKLSKPYQKPYQNHTFKKFHCQNHIRRILIIIFRDFQKQ